MGKKTKNFINQNFKIKQLIILKILKLISLFINTCILYLNKKNKRKSETDNKHAFIYDQ